MKSQIFHRTTVWNLAIAGILLLYLSVADAASFSESVVLFVGITLVFFFLTLRRTKKISLEISWFTLLFIFLVATVATAIFWVRAWQGVPGRMMAGLFLDILVVAFWWPGVLYATLFRQPGDGWFPRSRRSFFRHAGAGFAGGVAGILIAWAVNEQMLNSVAEKAMYNGLEVIEQNLPQQIGFTYRLERETLEVEYDFSNMSKDVSYPLLKFVREQIGAGSRLIHHRVPRRVVITMVMNGKPFARLDWGPGRSGNPWKTLELDYNAAGIRSFPVEQDVVSILEEVSGESDTEFQFSLEEPRIGIAWTGDPARLTEASEIIHLSSELDRISGLISEIRLHFRDVEGFDVDLPGYSLGLDTGDTVRTMFRLQRFLYSDDAPVLLKTGNPKDVDILDEYRAPAVIAGEIAEFDRSHVRPLWPFLPETAGGHKVYLVRTGPEGEVVLLIHETGEEGTAFGPDTLYPGETIDWNSFRVTNAGRIIGH